MSEHYRLLFENAGRSWQQGCLLGNGLMGEVLYGEPEEESIALSHITFFSGSDSVQPYREKAAEAFQRSREAADRGDYEAVSALTDKFMGIRGNYGTNLPVGRLVLKLGTKPGYEEYERFWDLERGLTGCRFRQGTHWQERCGFSSHPDRIFVYRIVTEDTLGMSLLLSFNGGRNPCSVRYLEDSVSFRVQALENLHSDGREGVSLVGNVRVLTDRGELVSTKEGLWISGAGEILICLVMDTDYQLAISEGGEQDTEDRKRDWERQVMEQQGKKLGKLSLSCYKELLERHVQDVSELMNRQTLRLGKASEQIDGAVTVERLLEGVRTGKGEKKNSAKGRVTREELRLTELMYQLGRYLLLASSREDSPLPAPLQGVWNDDVACRIGWTCDMHLDINTQMNYWLSEPGNLGECHSPLFAWMEKRLLPMGRRTAAACYGRTGWVGELVSNAWGYAAPYWNRSLSPCPTGGIWQASDYMEHYRYGQDEEFLRTRALPVLEEAADFFLSYVWEKEDGFHCGPSVSPENAFLMENRKYFASNDCTYEVLMIRELFTELVECCEVLKAKGGYLAESTAAKCEQAKRVLSGLPEYRILKDGTLAEWVHDYPAADSQHRHTSHLLGLFPYHQITVEDTPKLAEAARRSIVAKLTPYEGWEDTGWARSLLALYCARLGDGKEAFWHLSQMQSRLTGSNLLVMHPPTRGAASFMEVYELDGNTGFSMAVLELLLQSHGGKIRLLPALPEQWSAGSITGAVMRGGVIVDLTWENGRPVELSLKAVRDTTAVLVYKEESREYSLTEGECKVIVWE